MMVFIKAIAFNYNDLLEDYCLDYILIKIVVYAVGWAMPTIVLKTNLFNC